jgi:Flp pilus assembly pilin Flp
VKLIAPATSGVDREIDQLLVQHILNIPSLVCTWFTVCVRREEGQTMAEYGILIAVIAIVVVIAAATLGSSISGLFSATSHKV